MGFDKAKQPIRIEVILIGDMNSDLSAQAKYGHLVNALRRQFEVVHTYDANLQGFMKLMNALVSFYPQIGYWREAFRKNIFAFKARSRRIATHLETTTNKVDVVLQVGVVFDAHWHMYNPPVVIYTDYTAYLSKQRPDGGRSPFTSSQLQQWLQLEQQAYQRATHVCSRSDMVRHSIIYNYNIPANQVTTVGGGINFATLPQPSARPSNNQPTALFIGQEFFRKGGDLVLKAFAQVRHHLPQARLLFLTNDPIPPNLPLEGVELIPFAWDRKLVEELYHRADVFVLPSRLETWGDVLLEAMAFNMPCIGVQDEPMEEIIINDKTGLLVSPEDVTSLAAAMITMLGNLSLTQQWGRAARERVEQRFTWDKVIEQIAPFITAAVHNRK